MLVQLASLRARIEEEIEKGVPRRGATRALRAAVGRSSSGSRAEEEQRFAEANPSERSDFFRDAAGSAYARLSPRRRRGRAARASRSTLLVGLYDKCIVRVENEPLELGFREHIGKARRARGRGSGRCAPPSRRP